MIVFSKPKYMTRPPQQPPPGLTAIHGQLHVPPWAFPPHTLPGKIQKAIGALTVQNRHLHYGFAQASTWEVMRLNSLWENL